MGVGARVTRSSWDPHGDSYWEVTAVKPRGVVRVSRGPRSSPPLCLHQSRSLPPALTAHFTITTPRHNHHHHRTVPPARRGACASGAACATRRPRRRGVAGPATAAAAAAAAPQQDGGSLVAPSACGGGSRRTKSSRAWRPCCRRRGGERRRWWQQEEEEQEQERGRLQRPPRNEATRMTTKRTTPSSLSPPLWRVRAGRKDTQERALGSLCLCNEAGCCRHLAPRPKKSENLRAAGGVFSAVAVRPSARSWLAPAPNPLRILSNLYARPFIPCLHFEKRGFPPTAKNSDVDEKQA
jgi:hypothetical protein